MQLKFCANAASGAWKRVGCGSAQHLQKLTSHCVEWFSYREEYLRSMGPFRDAVLAILAAIAKQETVRLSERVMAGLSGATARKRPLR